MAATAPLTKSRFKLALECPTRLYYAAHAATPGRTVIAEAALAAGDLLVRVDILVAHHATRTGWQAALPSWGLIDIDSGAPVDPWDLVDDRPIAMTHWELHDMAVQVVRQQLAAEGREVTAWQGNPDLDPALWCAGPDGPEWVVVRHVLFPATTARRPARLADTVRFLAPRSVRGHFATVSIANQEDLGAAPLRGGPMYARFLGLEPV